MKTRDAEALKFVLESGLWKICYDTGDVLTSRDIRGRPTNPPIWRSATFMSPSRQSSTRKRIWVNGRRVYANRVNWVLHHKKPIPDGFQIDHDDDNSLNDKPSNLVLMDAEGNRVKELANGRVKRFQPCTPQLEYRSPEFYEIRDALVNSIPRDIPPAQGRADMYGRFGISVPGQFIPIQEPLDWRINLAKDIKTACTRFLARLRGWLSLRSILSAARRFFDKTFLGFR